MPNSCAVCGCSNFGYRANGISLHGFPFANDERPEAKIRRKKWQDFVNLRKDGWTPGKTASICSKHFKKEDFERQFLLSPAGSQPAVPRLRRDKIGVCVWPTINIEPQFHQAKHYSLQPSSSSKGNTIASKVTSGLCPATSSSVDSPETELKTYSESTEIGIKPSMKDAWVQTPEIYCCNCSLQKIEIKTQRNKGRRKRKKPH